MRGFIPALGAGLLAAAMAMPAQAIDLPRPTGIYKAPVGFVAPFSWTGLYVGLNTGYGWAKATWGAFPFDAPEGGLLGGTIGYNLQSGAWVWGIEGDFDANWVKGTDNTGVGACSGAVGCSTKDTWLGTLRGRLGYSWNLWLPYVTGGAVFTDVKMTPNGGSTATDDRVGWITGAGLEYALSGPWSAKLEYLYADFGNATCNAGVCGVPITVSYK
ncbi:MAG: outer membrane protein, partial [Terriglobia bacterium]